ncbi:MAG TPA: hypothetical protein VEY93_07235 [Longimicrobium sp.]|nr:hypothetical protein [Longimicrobium sp.]
MLTAKEIEAAALELPKNELASLIDRLRQVAAARAISPAVLDAAERRLDAIHAGHAPTVAFDNLLAELGRTEPAGGGSDGA